MPNHGAGPAGLTAAIYLAPFQLFVRLVDARHCRAALIPRTRNHAGYPGGISGRDLLQRMRDQAAEFGAEVEQPVVERLESADSHFAARTGEQSWRPGGPSRDRRSRQPGALPSAGWTAARPDGKNSASLLERSA